MPTIFYTDDSVLKHLPKSIEEAENILEEYTEIINKTIESISQVCYATPNGITPINKGVEPVDYINHLFDKYYNNAYSENIFKYCDMLLLCEEYDKNPKGDNYFKTLQREITINDNISSEKERMVLYRKLWNENKEMEERLKAFMSASPKDVTPDGKDCLEYIAKELDSLFSIILENNIEMLKLTFLENESLCYNTKECKGLGQSEKQELFYDTKVKH